MKRTEAELEVLISKELKRTTISREIAMKVIEDYFCYKRGWLQDYINRTSQDPSKWNPTPLIWDVQDMVQAQIIEQLEHEARGEEDQS